MHSYQFDLFFVSPFCNLPDKFGSAFILQVVVARVQEVARQRLVVVAVAESQTSETKITLTSREDLKGLATLADYGHNALRICIFIGTCLPLLSNLKSMDLLCRCVNHVFSCSARAVHTEASDWLFVFAIASVRSTVV